MSKKMRWAMMAVVLFAALLLPALGWAQELEMAEEAAEESAGGNGMGLWAIIAGSGWLGIVLWSALLASLKENLRASSRFMSGVLTLVFFCALSSALSSAL